MPDDEAMAGRADRWQSAPREWLLRHRGRKAVSSESGTFLSLAQWRTSCPNTAGRAKNWPARGSRSLSPVPRSRGMPARPAGSGISSSMLSSVRTVPPWKRLPRSRRPGGWSGPRSTRPASHRSGCGRAPDTHSEARSMGSPLKSGASYPWRRPQCTKPGIQRLTKSGQRRPIKPTVRPTDRSVTTAPHKNIGDQDDRQVCHRLQERTA
jgi:hypothetical protein